VNTVIDLVSTKCGEISWIPYEILRRNLLHWFIYGATGRLPLSNLVSVRFHFVHQQHTKCLKHLALPPSSEYSKDRLTKEAELQCDVQVNYSPTVAHTVVPTTARITAPRTAPRKSTKILIQ
jgi:hypothetical protein